jgi:hypothetical protein
MNTKFMQFKKYLQPLDASESQPVSTSSQDRPLAPIIPKIGIFEGGRERNLKFSVDFDENFKKKQTLQSIYQNPLK